MSIVGTARASYARPQVSIGGKSRRIASDGELHKINLAIVALNEAKQATSEAEFLVKVSNSMKISRDLFRGRNDV
jgi:hypothetical protein